MREILKWDKWFILTNVLAITLIFLLLQINTIVVGDIKSSTTLYYGNKKDKGNIVIEEKDIKDIIIKPYQYNQKLVKGTSYQRYEKLMVSVKQEVIRRENERIKQLRLWVQEQLEVERIEKEKQRQKLLEMPSRGSENSDVRYIFEVTAYTAHCEGCSGITTSGLNVLNRTEYNGMKIIATDNSVIPMYSVVKIRYDNIEFYAISLDKGGAIKGYKIDLLVRSNNEAFDFGRRKTEVEIIRYGQ